MNAIDERIIFYAFRYALGRRTTAPCFVVDYLLSVWKLLDKGTQFQIHKEIAQAIEENKAGMKMDVELWKLILELKVDTPPPCYKPTITDKERNCG